MKTIIAFLKSGSKKTAVLAVLAAFAIGLAGASQVHAAASSIYVAQSAAGSGNGSSCANAYAYTWFNSSSNWGSGTGQIGPGTTVYICGTISVPANTEAFVFNGSGTSGSPITLYFESGAVLESPEWPADGSGGAIDLGGNSYITINGNGGTGGATRGIIEATSNGDSGAKCLSGSCTDHGDSNAIEAASGSSNITIEGLTIADMYVTTTNVPNGGGGTCTYIYGTFTNWTVTNNIMHDVAWCVEFQYSSGNSSNITITNNQIYNIDHGIAIGGYPSGANLSNIVISGNDIHDYSNWDTSSDEWHHDGVHIWGYNDDGSDKISGITINNNTFGGCIGQNVTAHVFIEHNSGGDSDVKVYNNTFADTCSGDENDGMLAVEDTAPGALIYNNTFSGASTDVCVGFGDDSPSNINFVNNLVSGCGTLVYAPSPASFASGGIHNNVYANCSGSNCFAYHGNYSGSISTWQSETGDTNSTYVSSADLSSVYAPGTGSAALGAGANLTSAGITTLDSDIAGVARPASGAWDVGAYEVSSGSTGTGTGTTTPPPTVTPPAITSAASASATVGTSFGYQIMGSNSPTSYGASGLPAGLSVSSAGLISGTPTAAGTYSVSLSATNSGGTGTATLTITVAAASTPTPTSYTLTVTKSGTGSGTVSGGGVNCGSTCSASVSSGTGVVLSASPASGSTFTGWGGACTGTGSCSLTMSAAKSVTATFTLQNTTPVVSVPAITSALSASATVGSAFSYQITASNSPTAYNIAGLPAGLTVSNNALIAGTPTVAGTYPVTLTATNSAGSGTATLTITINPAATTSTPTSTVSGSCSAIGSGWTNIPVTTQTSGTFTVSFNATPGANDIDSTIGLSPDAAQTFDDMAAIVRFNSSGDIDAIDGPGYSAASAYAYTGGTAYTFAVTVNLGNDTYSASVKASAGSTTTIALNYPFRTTQATPSSIAYVDAHNDAGATTLCNVMLGSSGSTTGSTGSTNPTSTPAVNPPVITGLSSGSSVVYAGSYFSTQIEATNNPTSYGATSLPTGLTVNPSTGLISGTLPSAGTYAISLSATNAGGTGTATLNFTVNAASTGSTPTSTTSAAPVLTGILPSSGATGSSVVLLGSGFGPSDTVLMNGMTAASDVASDGTSLTFTVPSSLAPNCTSGEACPDYMLLITPNTYSVTVTGPNGTSNAVSFTVTSVSGGGTATSTGSGSGSGSGSTGSGSSTASSTIAQLQALIASLESQLAALEAKMNGGGSPTGSSGTGSSGYHWTRDLYRGMSGSDVSALQQLLINANTGGAAQTLASDGVTGYFGSATQAALSEYQSAHGITPSNGYFGSKTQAYVEGQ